VRAPRACPRHRRARVAVVTRARASTRCGRERRTEMIGETERDTLLRADKIVDVEGEMPASGDLQHPTTTARRAIVALSTALIASLAMNAVQYTYVGTVAASNSPLGSGYALAAPKGLPREVHLDACGHGPRFSLMCVGEREDRRGSWRPSAMLGQAADASEEEEKKTTALGGSTNTDVEPLGLGALQPAMGATRYCRKDTWLLSCLFYKANINDEATDWKHVKEECDGEFECDGVNKYWTSDLWHIASSGNADGCDVSLMDGSGTDASAFYKEGSAGWHQYGPTGGDGSCKIVNSWGNPE